MRNLLTPALKGNEHLSFACMTGVLRVAREGLFSGLNNLEVDGVLDDRYDECFGFTPEEIGNLAGAYDLTEEQRRELAGWYEGYRFGTQGVYNPWSVLMYLDNKCRPMEYWTNMSSNRALGRLLRRADRKLLEGLASILGGGVAWSEISGSLVYPDLDAGGRGDAAVAAYTLLLMSGYLTATGVTRQRGGRTEWELVIPNLEVRRVCEDEILGLAPEDTWSDLRATVQDAVEGGRAAELEAALTVLLRRSVSFFDLEGENSYQMWMLGLLACMPDYRVTGNREAGEGRYDVCLAPAIRRLPGVIIEINAVRKKKGKKAARKRMEEMARDGIRQIRNQDYEAELRTWGVGTVLEFGVAFLGKTACVVTGVMVPGQEAPDGE